MRYRNIAEGIFHERPHRFGAMVTVGGKREYVHVKNTGRCREILLPGTKIYLEKSDNLKRKTGYSLISALKDNLLINIDSQVPNTVIREAVESHRIEEFDDIITLKSEKTYKDSRFDFYFERQNGNCGFIEVKGVTLDEGGTAMFPDAPTKRGLKHINGLIDALSNDYETWIIFLIQYRPAYVFTPNHKTDPRFSEALKEAFEKGVRILAYDSLVSRDSIEIGKRIPFSLDSAYR